MSYSLITARLIGELIGYEIKAKVVEPLESEIDRLKEENDLYRKAFEWIKNLTCIDCEYSAKGTAREALEAHGEH
mgnify:CR=1 FL=1